MEAMIAALAFLVFVFALLYWDDRRKKRHAHH